MSVLERQAFTLLELPRVPRERPTLELCNLDFTTRSAVDDQEIPPGDKPLIGKGPVSQRSNVRGVYVCAGRSRHNSACETNTDITDVYHYNYSY